MHVPKAEVPMTLESWQLFKHDWNLAQPCCIFEMTSLTRSCGEETLSQRRQTSALLNNSVQSLPRLQSYRVAKSALKKKSNPISVLSHAGASWRAAKKKILDLL